MKLDDKPTGGDSTSPPEREEFRRWQVEVEFWRKEGYAPRGSDRSGLWHDCAWVERVATLLAYQPNCVIESMRQEHAALREAAQAATRLASVVEDYMADLSPDARTAVRIHIAALKAALEKKA